MCCTSAMLGWRGLMLEPLSLIFADMLPVCLFLVMVSRRRRTHMPGDSANASHWRIWLRRNDAVAKKMREANGGGRRAGTWAKRKSISRVVTVSDERRKTARGRTLHEANLTKSGLIPVEQAGSQG